MILIILFSRCPFHFPSVITLAGHASLPDRVMQSFIFEGMKFLVALLLMVCSTLLTFPTGHVSTKRQPREFLESSLPSLCSSNSIFDTQDQSL